jgi:HSP20 family protein
MAPEDVDITVDNGVLTLAGEKKVEAERQQGGVTHSERRYGAFSRQIRLPGDVRPDSISANFKDGVLTVTMARQTSAAESGRKIPIDQA